MVKVSSVAIRSTSGQASPPVTINTMAAIDNRRFKLPMLRPGEYYLAAIDQIANGDWSDPQFLEPLRGIARPVSINEGDVWAVDLKLLEPR